jgi:hypothetical protein
MIRRLAAPLLALALLAALVPTATASEREVVAAIRATAKPIQKASNQAVRCARAKDQVACIRRVGPRLATAARNADRRIGAAFDGSERACFRRAVGTYRKGLRRMATGGTLLGRGKLRQGAAVLDRAARQMQAAGRALQACG